MVKSSTWHGACAGCAQIPQTSPWCGWVLSTGTWCCCPQLWPQRDTGSLGCAEGLGQCRVQNSQELQQDVLTGEVFIRRDLGSPTAGGMPVPQNSPGSHRVPFHQAAAFYHFNFILILFFLMFYLTAGPWQLSTTSGCRARHTQPTRERAKTARLSPA